MGKGGYEFFVEITHIWNVIRKFNYFEYIQQNKASACSYFNNKVVDFIKIVGNSLSIFHHETLEFHKIRKIF